MADAETIDYQRVNAMLLGWQCINSPKFETSTIASKAIWLMQMGLSRSDTADILGSTDNSLRVLIATDAKKRASK